VGNPSVNGKHVLKLIALRVKKEMYFPLAILSIGRFWQDSERGHHMNVRMVRRAVWGVEGEERGHVFGGASSKGASGHEHDALGRSPCWW